jgi:hypothetical protein
MQETATRQLKLIANGRLITLLPIKLFLLLSRFGQDASSPMHQAQPPCLGRNGHPTRRTRRTRRGSQPDGRLQTAHHVRERGCMLHSI